MDRSSSATRAYGLIMEKFSQTALACLFLLFVVQVNGYSKYGRTCKDIGCTSTEVCRIVDECDPNGYRCGYPTCEKVNAKLSCQTMNCAGGQNCIMENGHPKCVDDPKLVARRYGGNRPPAPPVPLRNMGYGIPKRPYSAGNRGNINNNNNNKGTLPNPNGISDRSRSGHRGKPVITRNDGKNHYKTHESTDSKGNRVWTFSS